VVSEIGDTMKTLRRKENTTIKAIQFDGTNQEQIESFIDLKSKGLHSGARAAAYDADGGVLYAVRDQQDPMRFSDGDWICEDAEGYFYVLADSLKKKIYEEV